MKRWSSLLLIILFCFSARDHVLASEQDRELSIVYFNAAQSLLEAGEEEAAIEYLSESISISSYYSDSYYLLGNILKDYQDRTAECLNVLYNGLRINNWRLYSRQEAVLLISSVLYRTKQYERLLALLDANSVSIWRGADFRFYRTRGLLALEREDEAVMALEEARKIFPEDERFGYLQAVMEGVPSPEEALRLEEISEAASYNRKRLLHFILSDPNEASSRFLIDQYLSLGGNDPLAIVAKQEAEGITDESLERFKELGGFSDLYALREMAGLYEEAEARSRILEPFTTFSGELGLDVNRDGFYEEFYFYSDGSLTAWLKDYNQNGVAEYSISFREGIPATVIQEEQSPPIEMHFDSYPWLASVVIEGEAGSIRYHLLPRQLQFPLVDEESIWKAEKPEILRDMRLSGRVPVLDETLLIQYSYLQETMYSDLDLPHASAQLKDGRVLRLFKDNDRDTRIDQIILYKDGLPVSGISDPDGDSYFEVSEQYYNNELILISVDENDDGTPEYFERYDDGNDYAWDFNEDGMLDAAEIEIGRNRILSLFSSRLDGQFDVYIYKLSEMLSKRNE